MATQTFHGNIWLKSGGHPVKVSKSATSPSAAALIIQAQFGLQFKSWAQHMASN